MLPWYVIKTSEACHMHNGKVGYCKIAKRNICLEANCPLKIEQGLVTVEQTVWIK